MTCLINRESSKQWEKRYHFNIDIIWQPNAIFSIKYQWNIRPHYSVELVLEFLFLRALALLEIALLLRQVTTVFSTLLAIITLWAELAIGGEITPLELGRMEGPSSEPSTLAIFLFKDALLIPSNLSYSSARSAMVLPFAFMIILPELSFVSNWKWGIFPSLRSLIALEGIGMGPRALYVSIIGNVCMSAQLDWAKEFAPVLPSPLRFKYSACLTSGGVASVRKETPLLSPLRFTSMVAVPQLSIWFFLATGISHSPSTEGPSNWTWIW